MHIWLVSAYDRPRGHSSRTYDFSRYLVKKGHQVTFFTNSFCHYTRTQKEFKGYFYREIIDDIEVVWLKTPKYRDNGLGRGLNMLANLFSFLRFGLFGSYGRPDVLVGPSVPLMTGLGALLVARRLNVAFVFEIRDVWPDALVLMGAIKKQSLLYFLFRVVEKILYKKSTGIISTLPFVSKHIYEAIGVRRAHEIIPNPVDLNLFDEPCCLRILPKDVIRVVYIGGFGHDHDVETILNVAQELDRNPSPTFEFELYGTGINRAVCEQIVTERGISNVHFHNAVEKSQVPDLQCRADILVAAITPTESYKFGLNLNKLGGYLASGKPVILIGDPPNDPVSESGAWFTVPARSVSETIAAIQLLTSMPLSEIQTRSERARKFVEHHLSVDVLGSRFESTLNALVETKNERSF